MKLNLRHLLFSNRVSREKRVIFLQKIKNFFLEILCWKWNPLTFLVSSLQPNTINSGRLRQQSVDVTAFTYKSN